MSMMVSFVLSFFPRDVLDEILNLIESVSEDFPSYSCYSYYIMIHSSCCKLILGLEPFRRIIKRLGITVFIQL